MDIEELPAEAETKPVAQLSAGHDINGEILQLLEADYDEYAENPIDYVKQLITSTYSPLPTTSEIIDMSIEERRSAYNAQLAEYK